MMHMADKEFIYGYITTGSKKMSSAAKLDLTTGRLLYQNSYTVYHLLELAIS
jgi:hypothetical protein